MIITEKELADGIPDDDSASKQERLLLYQIIRNIKPKVAVEIGTHRGLAAFYMAQALKDNGEGILHTTDPNDWEQEKTLAQFESIKDFIKVHRKKGEDLDIENVDFLFIDGFHEEEYVLAEFNHFAPRLTERAVVVFHDCGGDNEKVGVNSAIEKLGLETAFLPTENKMRIYGKFKPKD